MAVAPLIFIVIFIKTIIKLITELYTLLDKNVWAVCKIGRLPTQ